MKISIAFDDQRIADLLVSALEGGSRYWCRIDKWGNVASIVHGTAYASLCETDGGKDATTHRLDKTAVKRGLEAFPRVAPRHFGNWLAAHDDAETGDVFLQLCLFGEIKYG